MTTEVIITLLLLTVLVLGVLTVQVVNFITRRRWRTHEQYPFLADELGLERAQDRFLIDTRIQRYRGTRHGRETEVEVGAGSQGVYVRVDYHFQRTVDFGVRISSEHEDGFTTRLLRLREIEVGHKGFDSQFILLSRDEDRLHELLDHDIRRMLLALREDVRDLRLNDDGLHLQVLGALGKDELKALIDRGAELASNVFRRTERIMEERQKEQTATTEAFAPVTGTLPAVTPGAPEGR